MELDDTILQSKTTIELVGFIKRLWKQMLLHDELSHVTVTTAESAKDMKQKPVYILNHADSNAVPRGLTPTLDEVESECALTARKIYEGAGIFPFEVLRSMCPCTSCKNAREQQIT